MPPVQTVTASVPVGQLNGTGGTFPSLGFRAYREDLEWPTRINEYQNGWVQQKSLALNPRRRYTLTVNLSAAQAATFRTFYDTHGKTVPFQFWPFREGSVKVVRFDSGYSQSVSIGGRVQIDFVLVEVQ
jgi:phage-related protein